MREILFRGKRIDNGEWVGNLEYFRAVIAYEGYTVTQKGD